MEAKAMDILLTKPTVKMRGARTGSSGGGRAYSLTIPSDLARAIERAGIDTFEVELTEDGILYRPVESQPDPVLAVPSWLKGGFQADEPESEVESDARQHAQELIDRARTKAAQ